MYPTAVEQLVLVGPIGLDRAAGSSFATKSPVVKSLITGSGQFSPAAANRARHSCTVLRATLIATAIARSERAHSNFNRKIARTRRMDTLSAGIGPPSRPDERTDRSLDPGVEQRHPSAVGRPQIGTADITSESVADMKSECPADLLGNTQTSHQCRPGPQSG